MSKSANPTTERAENEGGEAPSQSGLSDPREWVLGPVKSKLNFLYQRTCV